MSSEIPAAARGAKFRKDLDREAVGLALNGEWERAIEVNRAILELFADDVEAMNRLTKALIELGSYEEAGDILDRVCSIAPYNNIARRNRARLEQMRGSNAAATRHARRSTGALQLFIGESGKSATTVLRHTPRRLPLASPGDPVTLVIEHHGISVYADDGQHLGQVETRLGHRLSRLIGGGNTYAAAILGVNGEGISVIIHETSRHRSLQNVASFTTRAAPPPGQPRERDDDPADALATDEEAAEADEEEDEGVIDEEELQAAWSENE
jgi:tetratricopeptide (TPR) repeat protein